ncbi:MAG: trigger factor [Gammaproteobacteria bacterium]|jgi:trigger factor
MQVSIESLEGLQRRMTVQIPSDRVNDAVQKKLNELRKSARIDGFRPGKVPLKVVQQKFGGHVRQEVVGEVLESSYREALEQEDVRPAGMPSIESISSEEREDMSYTALFEVFPTVESIELSAIQIEKPVTSITDDDFAQMLAKLQGQRKEWSEVKRKAKKDDQVLVDFEGRIDGEIFEGGAGKDMAIELGAGQMLEEFEKGLVGMKTDEEKVVEVNFPEDYQGTEVAGKRAEFTLKVTRVSAPELPEIDGEFIKAFGVEDGDMDRFHSEIRANMEKELSQRLKANIKNKVMDGLLEANDLNVPSALVDEEVKSLKSQAAQRMGQEMGNMDESMLPSEMFTEEASKRVKLGLLISELVKIDKIEVDQQKVEETLEEMITGFEQPDQVREFYKQNREARANLENITLEQQVVDHILSKANISEKEVTFEALMNGEV